MHTFFRSTPRRRTQTQLSSGRSRAGQRGRRSRRRRRSPEGRQSGAPSRGWMENTPSRTAASAARIAADGEPFSACGTETKVDSFSSSFGRDQSSFFSLLETVGVKGKWKKKDKD
ncbi:hypothetical protein HPP92_007026 [Vanilla planifolia]|uniref:Uncharacterized protein n=1 Tax=Vanilla planifolia TaxID=51239 RepID=A0A835V908_VANPL|nr:hypothetical protein HPP92_007026 [Vanilla planifolia]